MEENLEHISASNVPIDDRCCHAIGSRNLIVCIDGTSNQFGEKNTNVIELYNLILKDSKDRQRTWYNSGIGTYARPSWKSLNFYKKVIYHKIDLAIAWDFERTVLGAYRWLSDNYELGDCIFLFGFSRGAFQVRVLSAMIDKVGLIHKGNEMQIPFAYELYSDPNSDKPKVAQVGSQEKMSMAARFKSAFSHKDVKVHFVGAWDTVSSIGIARGKRLLPRTVEGMQHVCFFRHALALDERRVKFLPEYAYGGIATNPEDDVRRGSSDDDDAQLAKNNEVTKESTGKLSKKSTRNHPHTTEVWFAGTHSDIGGGNVENAGMDRSTPPLRWMVFQAGALGLRTSRFMRELPSIDEIEIKESLTWCWWPLEFLPLNRLSFLRDDGKLTTRKLHLGSGRYIHIGQKIHSSLVTSKIGAHYTPKARPRNEDKSFWKRLQTGELPNWLEFDLYIYTQNVLDQFIEAGRSRGKLQALQQIATSGDGQQALYESLINALNKNPNLEPERKIELLRVAMDTLVEPDLKLGRSVDTYPLVSDLWKSNNKDHRELARNFILGFTDPCALVLDNKENMVLFVAFSPDGTLVASGSDDNTIQVWNSKTGMRAGEQFRGHTNVVRSVAFSPDGKHIVSGSVDKTVRIWNTETGEPVGKPLHGHTKSVRSVVFSPDNRFLISGSYDKTIRIWDLRTGTQVGKPLRGHTDWVRSVSTSPDGKQIISGSDDKTIRIWDPDTGEPIGEPFRGHTDCVTSVAFSPDGHLAVSGSFDRTVRIWDARTGGQVGEPFRGHADFIRSIAFSPNGKYVVSGSDDKTVSIWDTHQGVPARKFKGHTDYVRSVAFSPDGNYVVSGSEDHTMRIWQVVV